MPRILILAGSARRDSVNLKLGQAAARIATELGAEVEVYDPRGIDVPLYHGDLEEEHGLPEAIIQLKRKFLEADALLFCSPEYNSSITPMLKNLIDWVSRPASEDEPPLACYRGKVAALLAASPGALGGLRGLVHLRAILGNIGVHVIPTQFAMGSAYEKFSESGELTDDQGISRLKAVVSELVETTGKLSA
jgi:NAD(P)H-dependent FMN reductase